jgi:hypothetical protein
MDSITLPAYIDENHHLIIDLPPDIPSGAIEVVIRPLPAPEQSIPLTRETARAKLLAAGALATYHRAPEGTVPLTPEQRMEIGKLPDWARPSEELVDEDRGEY